MEYLAIKLTKREMKKIEEEAIRKRLSLQEYCRERLNLVAEEISTMPEVMHPKNGKNIICELGVTANAHIYCKSIKDEKIIEIVKSLRMKWEPDKERWYRKISPFCGSVNDRLAELANKLLLAGFSVSLDNETVKEKAYSGSYEPEYDKWVTAKNGKLLLKWFYQRKEESNRLYCEAKRLKSAKWQSGEGMLINIGYYEEINDFAEINGFAISDEARKLIEDYAQQEKNKIEVKAPELKEEHKEELNLEDLLDD